MIVPIWRSRFDHSPPDELLCPTDKAGFNLL